MLINPKEIREKFGQNYRFNSWEHVDGLRDVILEGRYRVTKGLEHEWQLISKDKGSPSHNQGKPRDFLEADTNTPIEVLSTYLEMGTYPPPEILMAIVDCFTLYYQHHGEMELEEACFGRSKRKSGSFSARRSRDLLYRFFLTSIHANEEFGERLHGKRLSLGELAEDFLARMNVQSIDVETFLRGFRRWKASRSSNGDPADSDE